MGLRDEVATDVKRPGKPCGVAVQLERMPKKLAREAIEVLGDSSVQHAAFSRTLNRLGYPVSEYSIMKHRRGECRCAKS